MFNNSMHQIHMMLLQTKDTFSLCRSVLHLDKLQYTNTQNYLIRF